MHGELEPDWVGIVHRGVSVRGRYRFFPRLGYLLAWLLWCDAGGPCHSLDELDPRSLANLP